MNDILLQNMKLKVISRVVIAEILTSLPENCDPTLRIYVAYAHKSIDLFHGILSLYEEGIPETSQALARCLFECYLKIRHFDFLVKSKGGEYASTLLMDSVMIEKAKSASEQGILNEHNDLEIIVLRIKEKYTNKEINFIKNHGFSMLSVFELAKKYDMLEYYHCIYRNFSRNVHGNDHIEYLCKQPHMIDYQEDNRDIVTLGTSSKIIKEILINIRKKFHHISISLEEIENQY